MLFRDVKNYPNPGFKLPESYTKFCKDSKSYSGEETVKKILTGPIQNKPKHQHSQNGGVLGLELGNGCVLGCPVRIAYRASPAHLLCRAIPPPRYHSPFLASVGISLWR